MTARITARIPDRFPTAKILIEAESLSVTRRGKKILSNAGVRVRAGEIVTLIGPNEGDMACGEYGPGRMAEPAEILAAVESYFAQPEAEKWSQCREPGHYRGYIPTTTFSTDDNGGPSVSYEAFIVGAEVEPGDPSIADSNGIRWPTPWPASASAGCRRSSTACA